MSKTRIIGSAVWCVLLGVALNAWASTLSQSEVVKLLSEPALIAWGKWVTSSDEMRSTASVLQNVFQNSTYSSAVRNRAIVEYGHFVAGGDEALSKDAVDLYQQMLSQPVDGSEETLNYRVAVIQSLKNAFTPESVDLVASVIDDSDIHASLYAMNTLDELLSSEPTGTRPLPPDLAKYQPKIGTPLQNRAHAGDWKSAAARAQASLSKLADKKQLPENVKQQIQRTQGFIQSSLIKSGGAQAPTVTGAVVDPKKGTSSPLPGLAPLPSSSTSGSPVADQAQSNASESADRVKTPWAILPWVIAAIALIALALKKLKGKK